MSETDPDGQADGVETLVNSMAAGLAAIGSAISVNLLTFGDGSLLEHRVIFIASVALVIVSLAAWGAARKDRERDPGRFLR